ncbi:MAG: DUF427 domain-containing protein [Gloeomargarita sp. DG02_5_bins_242]
MTHSMPKESVWDYPRPPRVEPTEYLIEIYTHGLCLARTQGAYRVLETSHPPVYYLPPQDIQMQYLRRNARTSFCEWKGQAHYYDLQVEGQVIRDVAWSYAHPTAAFRVIQDYLAFYAQKCERCLVAGEVVTPQPGGFYGGWITANLVGPFKGQPGSWGW